ncbi:hypothetical protein EAE96_003200 [Botrytis aclada]|nr:hypothetical protein EAE96_003200 [Botrytis aclada]
MSHAAMQAPPVTLMPQSLLSLPSLKQYMVHRVVHEGTVATMEAALRQYVGHYHAMAKGFNGVSESTITYMADKHFWQYYWPYEPFPRQVGYLTPHDRAVIHKVYSQIPIGRRYAIHEQFYYAYCVQQRRYLQIYVEEARAWSKSIGDKIAQMAQKGEKVEDHGADDHQDEGLQQLAQLEI